MAMAYPGSRSHGWVAGERVDDTVLNEWAPKNVAWGNVVAPLSLAGPNQSIGTSQDITGVTRTFTALAGRQYRALLHGMVKWTTNPANTSEYVAASIKDSGGGTLGYTLLPAPSAVLVNTWMGFSVAAYFTASGSFTVKATVEVNGATPTGRVNPNGGLWLLGVEDIGPTAI